MFHRSSGDYHGFPPMFFSVGTHEMLYDETLQVVEKLKACQVPVTCEIQPGMFHIYVVFARLVPEGKISYHRLLDFIRANFCRLNRLCAYDFPMLSLEKSSCVFYCNAI